MWIIIIIPPLLITSDLLCPVASTKRSFSKLELLKNYLRSPMTQDWLNGLVTVCTEKLLDKIDVNSIIDIIVPKNGRRSFIR
jgi:hypothetical protein